MMRVLVTGGSGFIGGAVARGLSAAGMAVRVSSRTGGAVGLASIENVQVGALGAETDWRSALEGVTAVVHAAGLAHGRYSRDDLWRANVEGVDRLARQAAGAGVRRMVLLSSIKAACDRTTPGAAAVEKDARPVDDYGRSKLGGERAILAHSELMPVALRPPMVFGAEARANFGALMRLSHSGLPLPFAGISNRRSLISIQTLVASVRSILQVPDGPAGVFHVADGPAVSTAEIVTALRAGWGRKAGLIHVPGLIALAPRALKESLVVDDTAFRAAYGYGDRTDVDVRESLRRCAAEWAATR